MSLNNISLPPQLIADLYEHALVGETLAPDTTTAVPQTPPVPSLGKAAKGILIVVNNSNAPFLPDAELDFLTKVLSACQLSLADVAIINWCKVPHQKTEAILNQFDPKAVILFDVAPAGFQLPPDLPSYTVTAVGQQQFVLAPALHQIEKTKEAKAQLWTALKQLFGL